MKKTPNEMKFYTLPPNRLFGLLECGCALCKDADELSRDRDLGYCR